MTAPAGSIAHPFQDDLERVEAEAPPWHLRVTTLALAALLVCTIGLAAVTRIDIDVTGLGQLRTENPISIVGPLDRAMIAAVLVHGGDTVKQGQVLATLDGTFAATDVAALGARLQHLTAEAQRLQDEETGIAYDAGQGGDVMQARLATRMLGEYQAKLYDFDQTLAQDEAARSTQSDQILALRHQVDVASQVAKLREALLRGAVGSRLQYLDALGELGRLSGELATAQGKLTELTRAKSVHQADRAAYIKTWQRDIADQAKKNQDALEETQAALTKAIRVNQLVTITAPRDGVVLEVADRGAGSVLKEAEPLMVLLPARDGLKADINIKSADIGYVRVGDAVDVKVDAYPYQLHGVLHGTVHAIAAASFTAAVSPDGTSAGIAAHSVTVSLNNIALNDLPQGTGPIAGMTVSGDVHVGTRSVLAYFLMPVTRGFASSLREP